MSRCGLLDPWLKMGRRFVCDVFKIRGLEMPKSGEMERVRALGVDTLDF